MALRQVGGGGEKLRVCGVKMRKNKVGEAGQAGDRQLARASADQTVPSKKWNKSCSESGRKLLPSLLWGLRGWGAGLGDSRERNFQPWDFRGVGLSSDPEEDWTLHLSDSKL